MTRQRAIQRRRGRQARAGYPSFVEAFQDLKADFAAAQESSYRPRLTGVHPGGSGADYHYRNDAHLLKIIERARNLDRNDDIIGQGITRLVDNCLQDGLTPLPNTGSQELNEEIKARFREWSEDPNRCHIGGEESLQDMARMAFRSMIVDGDCCILPTDDGTLEPMEAHRLRSPDRTKRNVVHGVELDDKRLHLNYWFMKEDIGPTHKAGMLVRQFTQVAARDEHGDRAVFFIRNPKRFSQTRGVSALAPIMDTSGYFGSVGCCDGTHRRIRAGRRADRACRFDE